MESAVARRNVAQESDAERQPARARPRLLWAALIIFIISAALRIAWTSQAHVTPVSDFRGYDTYANEWIESGDFGWHNRMAYRTPGYPGFLALIYRVAENDIFAATVVQAVLGGLASGLIVLLAGAMTSVPAAVLAGMLHMLSPSAIAYIPVLASENLAAPLLIGGVTALVYADAPAAWRRWLLMFVGGLCFGWLLLARPAALFLIPAALLLACFSFRRWRLQWASPVFFLAGGMVFMAPWMIRNHRVGLGATTLSTTGGINLHMGNNDLAEHGGYCPDAIWRDSPIQDERELDQAYVQAAKQWILSNPGRYLRLCGIRLRRLLGVEPDVWVTKYFQPTQENDELWLAYRKYARSEDPELQQRVTRARQVHRANLDFMENYRVLIAPLALLGLLLSFARWRAFAPLNLTILSYVAGIALTYFQPRFRELSDPLLFIPVAALLSDIVLNRPDLGRWPNRWVKLALAVGLVVLTMILRHNRLL